MTFRQLANRLASLKQGGGRLAASLLLGFLLIGMQPQTAQAMGTHADKVDDEPVANLLLPADRSSEVIQQVLDGKDFGGKRSTEEWALKEFEFDSSDDSSSTDLSWIGDIIRALANVMEVLLWAGVILLAMFLIFRISRMVNPDAFKRDDAAREIPAMVSGLDIRPESLPDDVAGSARRLWLEAKYREAMSLLYRGTVSSLVHAYEVELTEGATEGDVLLSAKPRLKQDSLQLLDQITGLWQAIAYAHRSPADDQALAVFDRWPGHFANQSASSEVMQA